MPHVTIAEARKVGWSIMVYLSSERDPEFYYAHSIRKEGNKDDGPNLFTMWGWINHMRGKTWWNPKLEEEFITAVKRVLN